MTRVFKCPEKEFKLESYFSPKPINKRFNLINVFKCEIIFTNFTLIVKQKLHNFRKKLRFKCCIDFEKLNCQ